MKTAKRLLSLVLVLAMVACLGVTAFADTPATPYINVTVKNSRSGATTSWTVAATTSESVKEALDKAEAATVKWNPVSDYYKPEITHYALTSLRGFASTKFDSTNPVDQANLLAKGYDFSKYTWYTGNYKGYGLVSHDETTGKYTYIYAGYDWTYNSNKSAEIWDYMCCYKPQADEIIYLTYDLTVSIWTTTTPLV